MSQVATTTPKNGRRGRPDGPRLVLVVQRQGDDYACVQAIVTPTGEVRIVEATARDLAGVRERARKLHATEDLDAVVRVIPGGSTIVRCVTTPSAGDEQAVQALSLLGEANLPEAIPAYRRGSGVIPGRADAGAGRVGLLCAWVGGADEPALGVEGVAEEWIAPVAALAFLRDQADPGVAWYADAGDGSIAVISDAAGSTSARVLYEDNSTAQAWASALSEAIGAIGAGMRHEPKDVTAQRTLGLGHDAVRALAARVEGLGDGAAWWDQYGLAVGGALAAATPSSGTLARMRAVAPVVREHALMRAAGWLGSARHAWVAAGVALALLVGAPFAIAWARSELANKKAAGLAAEKVKRVDMDRRASVYAQVEADYWPMTKLIQDISRCTPLNVTITSMQISRDTGVSLQGVSKTRTLADELSSALNRSGVFSEAQIKRTTTNSEGLVEFDLGAKVADPHRSAAPDAKGEDDWAAKPLAVRLHGEGASNTQAPAGSEPAKAASRRTARSGDTGDEPETPRAERPKRDANELPKELADAEIGKMDVTTAMREWTGRRKYIQANPSLDKATVSRLEGEIERLKARQQAARGGG